MKQLSFRADMQQCPAPDLLRERCVSAAGATGGKGRVLIAEIVPDRAFGHHARGTA